MTFHIPFLDFLTMSDKVDLKFTDISVEAWREYRFPGGDVVRIEDPSRLHVSASGGHRLHDGANKGHYVPTGWIHLHWEPKPGQQTFVK